MKNLYTKLYTIQQLSLAVSKDGKNPHFKSAYPTLDNVIEVLTPVLNKNGILVTHFAENDTFVTRVVDTESGEAIDSRYTMTGTTPQQRGSEQTYFRRYSMIALFNLPSEDDDGNASSINATTSNETTSTGKTTSGATGKHTCTKCHEVVEGKVFDGKFGPCFKCPKCNGFSKSNPIPF